MSSHCRKCGELMHKNRKGSDQVCPDCKKEKDTMKTEYDFSKLQPVPQSNCCNSNAYFKNRIYVCSKCGKKNCDIHSPLYFCECIHPAVAISNPYFCVKCGHGIKYESQMQKDMKRWFKPKKL